MSFDVIGLCGKPDAPGIETTMRRICQYLKAHGHEVLVDEATASALADTTTGSCSLSELARRCSALVSVGGDGTLLRAARAAAEQDTPLVGINLGRLGFLVDVSPDQACETLDEIFAGHHVTDTRWLLRLEVLRDGRIVRTQTAFNEVVVHRWTTPSMLELSTQIDGVYLNAQRCDGLIVSTPTGSTAYALSAGGPILHPTLRSIVLVPLSPHMLTNRPIVIHDGCTVDIAFRHDKRVTPQVTCDDVAISDIEVTDTIRIRRDTKPLRLLHPQDYDFFEILRVKLNWSRDT